MHLADSLTDLSVYLNEMWHSSLGESGDNYDGFSPPFVPPEGLKEDSVVGVTRGRAGRQD